MATKDTVVHVRVTKQIKAALQSEARKDKRKLSALCEIILTNFVGSLQRHNRDKSEAA